MAFDLVDKEDQTFRNKVIEHLKNMQEACPEKDRLK